MNRKLYWLIQLYISYVCIGIPLATITAIWPNIASRINVDVTNIAILTSVFLVMNVMFLVFASVILSYIGSRETILLGVLIQGIGLLIMSYAYSFEICVIAAFVLGIGSGLVDTTSSYYLTKYYEPKHIMWLHCFWGLGAFMGPFIFARILSFGFDYTSGCRMFFPFYFLYAAVVFISLYIEKKKGIKEEKTEVEEKGEKEKKFRLSEVFTIKNVLLFLICMFFIDFMQGEISTWYSSYSVGVYKTSEIIGADLVSLFFIGTALARIVSGFLIEKVGIKRFAFININIFIATSILFIFNIEDVYVLYICSFLFGVGVGPLFPLLINFSKEIFPSHLLQGVIGLAGSAAQLGALCASVIIGVIVKIFSINSFTYVTFFSSSMLLIAFTLLNNKSKKIK